MEEEELEALAAIYCESGEFEVVQNGYKLKETIVKICRNVEVSNDLVRIEMTIATDASYPQTKPELSVCSPCLNREQNTTLKNRLDEYANDLLGQPMLMDLITQLHEYLQDVTIFRDDGHDMGVTSAELEPWVTLIHLDHMRDRVGYTKSLESWTLDLGLTGRLIFQGRLILLVLCGPHKATREFIHRLKSVNVDVDSRGKRCKEKMMTVLADEPTSWKQGNDCSFKVETPKSRDELSLLFKQMRLERVHNCCVKPLPGLK